MNEKQILIAFLVKTLNMTPESVAELLYKKSDDGTDTLTDELNENAIDALSALDKERVTKLKPDTKVFFDNGYKKAQAEVSAKYENAIREKSGIDNTELTGEELIAAAIANVSKAGKLDDEKVKMHPLFLSREKALQQQIDTEKAAAAAAVAEIQANYKREQITGMAQQRAKELLLSMKPVLEDDAKIANKRIEYFLNEFKGLEYEQLEDGTLVPIKDGKRLENEHFHPIGFEQLVQSIAAESFKFQVQDPKGNAGNKNEPGNPGYTPGATPKTEAELWEVIAKAPPEQKKTIMQAWEKEHGEVLV